MRAALPALSAPIFSHSSVLFLHRSVHLLFRPVSLWVSSLPFCSVSSTFSHSSVSLFCAILQAVRPAAALLRVFPAPYRPVFPPFFRSSPPLYSSSPRLRWGTVADCQSLFPSALLVFARHTVFSHLLLSFSFFFSSLPLSHFSLEYSTKTVKWNSINAEIKGKEGECVRRKRRRRRVRYSTKT